MTKNIFYVTAEGLKQKIIFIEGAIENVAQFIVQMKSKNYFNEQKFVFEHCRKVITIKISKLFVTINSDSSQ